MFLLKTRKHHNRVRRLPGLITENPVLALGLALPFVIAASYSLRAALCVFTGMVVATLPTVLLASLTGSRLPAFIRTPVYALCAMALLLPAEALLTAHFPVILDSLGVYFPVLAVNTLLMHLCEKEELWGHPLAALRRTGLALAGFGAVMGIVACVRELFGAGTLWGMPVSWTSWRIDALLFPFGGLIVIAFLAAGCRAIGRLLRGALYQSDQRLQRDMLRDAAHPPRPDGVDGTPISK